MSKKEALGVEVGVAIEEKHATLTITTTDGEGLTVDHLLVGACGAFCEAMGMIGKDPVKALKSYFDDYGVTERDVSGSNYKQ